MQACLLQRSGSHQLDVELVLHELVAFGCLATQLSKLVIISGNVFSSLFWVRWLPKETWTVFFYSLSCKLATGPYLMFHTTVNAPLKSSNCLWALNRFYLTIRDGCLFLKIWVTGDFLWTMVAEHRCTFMT